MLLELVLALIITSFVLIKSADFVLISLKRISDKTHVGAFALSAILLALGTSFPELFVGITSALEKTPNLTVGVVIGSNIANLALVSALAGLSAGKIYIKGEVLKKDLWVALVSGLAPLILISDGNLTRIDGIVLLAAYIAYASSFFREQYKQIGKAQVADNAIKKFIRTLSTAQKGAKKDIIRLTIGLAVMLVSADVLVRVAKEISLELNIPVFIVGLIVVAIGTSLPELAFSYRSIRNHEPGMFLGNILGSVIANSTLIIGLTALIAPVSIATDSTQYILAAGVFILVSLSFWYFALTKRRVDRWESLLLLAIYIIFIVLSLR